MIASLDFHGLSLTDMVVLAGFLALGLREIADFRGWSRSSRTLRVENTDLLRRNAELEGTVSRHEAQIADLDGQVKDLRSRDQAAVLTELKRHEDGAEGRNDKVIGVLDQILERMKETPSLDGSAPQPA